MPDSLSNLVPDARAFLGALSVNNNRDWFEAQKPRYEERLKSPAMALLEQVAVDLERRGGQPLKPKLFRPYRDLRFSQDKTPYHTHLHMAWAIEGPGRQKPGLFFGISPAYVRIGGGIMGFDKPVVENWRQAVDGAFGDAMQVALDRVGSHGYAPGEPELKRVPAPYDTIHPHADLLRRKSLVVWKDLSERDASDPERAVSDMYDAVQPLFGLLYDVL